MKDNNDSEAPKKRSRVAIKCTLAYDVGYTRKNENGLAPIVRQHFKSKGTLKEMLDPKLQEESYEKGFTLSKGPNKDSLRIFSKIGYQCLSEKQEHRPTMKAVIKELEEALKCQCCNSMKIEGGT
ncbi:hypothetical protein E3N88_32927 [Mikania micrantha]|uniref:Serine-threonine/tyrosine-protein kinase catalytic domain-containing protein n=1 Tax=Mikania micrantha TaxID=192012 RepID=A0A5N6MAC2_9ASTR|nr:hypothetical protein E3N88_32927 [Mikania micrantha]